MAKTKTDPTELTPEEMIREIAEQAAAIAGEELTEAQLNQIEEKVEEIVEKRVAELDGQRGPQADPKTQADNVLRGSKWERLGLTAADLDLGFSVLEQNRGVKPGLEISEELANAVKEIRSVPNHERAIRRREPLEGRTRDMGTDQAGVGDEMIADTLYGAQFLYDARTIGRVWPLIQWRPQTALTETHPVRAAFPEPILGAESQGDSASNYGTQDIASNRVSVTVKKLVWHSIWPTELSEASLFPLLPFAKAELMDSYNFYKDALVLRGDTTDAGTGNINSDDADPDATKWFLKWDGIAHVPLVNLTSNAVDAAAALTYSKITNLRSLVYDATYFLDWGHPDSPADFVFVADPQTADEIADLDELVTRMSFGERATVFTGQVGNIGANPLIASAALGRAEADGKMSNTASNNTLGRVLGFNRRGYVGTTFRAPTVKTDEKIETDQFRIVMTAMHGFGIHTPTGNLNAAEQAALLYNI